MSSVGTRRAMWVLAAFAFTIPPEHVLTIPGVGSVSRVVGLIAFIAGLASLFDRGRFTFRMPSLFVVVAALFMLWSTATFYWSVDPAASLSTAFTFGQFAVLIWLMHQLVRTEQDLGTLYQSFVLGAYVLIAVGMAVFFGDGGGYRDVGATNPNIFARVAALAIPMAWSLAMGGSRGWLRLLNLVYPVFGVAAVILTASRGGFITALVALLIVPLILGRLGLPLRLAVFVATASLMWAGFTYVPTAFPELQRNLDRLGETGEELLEGTLTGRTVIWAAGAEVFLDAPLVGIGLGGFNAAVEPILGSRRSPHNTLLSVSVGSGLIGLFLYASLLGIVLVGILVDPRRRLEHLVLLTALVVGMLATSADDDKYAWFILGAFAAVRPVMLTIRPVSAMPAARQLEGGVAMRRFAARRLGPSR
jgi:O-antigen ligase